MRNVNLILLFAICFMAGEALQVREILQAAAPLTEEQKIARLLETVARSQAVFIRNGREYPASRAVEHLKEKYNHIRDRIQTAKQFIEHVASRSSLSGRPYRVRFPDGRVRKTSDWLAEELRNLEKKGIVRKSDRKKRKKGQRRGNQKGRR